MIYLNIFIDKSTTTYKPIPNTVVVQNNTNYDIETTAKITIYNIFSIDSIFVKFDYMPTEIFIEGRKIGAYIFKNPFFDNQYVVFMSRDIKKYQKDIIIIHEMIHLNQYEIKELKFYDPIMGIFIYKEDTINMNTISYFDRPFEKDAYNMEDSIYNLMDSILINSHN